MPKQIQKATTFGESTPGNKTAKTSLLPVIKPKKAQVGYMFFINEQRPKLMEKNPDSKVTEIAKMGGEQWKQMSEAQKKPYEDKAVKDKARHDKEMAQFNKSGYFVNQDGVKSTDMKITIKDFPEGTVLPKKPKSSFIIFQAENLKLIRKANPDMKITEVMKKSALDWPKLSKGKRAQIERLHEADKKRYEKQVKELEKKGYFTTEDGTKSIDMKFKPKKVSLERRKEIQAKKAKTKMIEKAKTLRLREVAKKKSLREKQAALKEKEKAKRTSDKAKSHAKAQKEKEKKTREHQRAKGKKSKLTEKSKKSRDAKLKSVSKKSKAIKKVTENVSTKPIDEPQNNGLRAFTQEKLSKVLEQCSGSLKSKQKQAIGMIKEMWSNASQKTRSKYMSKAKLTSKKQA